jgi:hypothetical protein
VPTSTAFKGMPSPVLVCPRAVMAIPVRNRVVGRSTRRGYANKVPCAHCANTLCTESRPCRRWCRHPADCGRVTKPCRRSPDSADYARRSLRPATCSVLDLRDEPTPLVVDNVPRVGPTQLCNAQRVRDTAGIDLRPDIGYPSAIASCKCPHSHTRRYGRRREQFALPSLPSSAMQHVLSRVIMSTRWTI